MFECEVVDNHNLRNAGMKAGISICRKEKGRLVIAEPIFYRYLEPPIPEQRMPCGRKKDYRLYIIAKNEFVIVWPVEKKIKIDFRVGLCNSFQRFISKQPDALQLVFDQETGINGYALALWHE